MSGTTVRLSEEAKERLTLLKREGESYEDVIMRLTETDKWAGFGALEGTETSTSEGMKRVHDEIQSGLDDDIGEDD